MKNPCKFHNDPCTIHGQLSISYQVSIDITAWLAASLVDTRPPGPLGRLQQCEKFLGQENSDITGNQTSITRLMPFVLYFICNRVEGVMTFSLTLTFVHTLLSQKSRRIAYCSECYAIQYW